MSINTCLLTSFIRNNDVVSCCDFIPEKLNAGVVIYEVVRVINGIPLFYNEHVNRYYSSVNGAGFVTSLSKKSLKLRIKALIQINGLVDGNIKFQCGFFPNHKEIFSAWVCPFSYPSNNTYHSGIIVKTLDLQRTNPSIKSYSDDYNSKVKFALTKDNIYEVLLVNNDGYITEGSKSNIFFVDKNIVYTPKVNSVLPGVTRQKIIDATYNIGVVCKETVIPVNLISEYQGAFITGTSPKVLPVAKINSISFNPKHNTILKLMAEYDKSIERDISLFAW